MQFWQQMGKGLDFLSGFQGCFSGTFQTHTKKMEHAKVITKVYALILDRFSWLSCWNSVTSSLAPIQNDLK